MKEIKAVIQPFMLGKVIDRLKELGELPGVTVSEVKGFGKGQAKNAKDVVQEDSVDFILKAKLEIVVVDAMVDQVVRAIAESARTGQMGDGKIFVYDVSDVVKVRTGERGERAI